MYESLGAWQNRLGVRCLVCQTSNVLKWTKKTPANNVELEFKQRGQGHCTFIVISLRLHNTLPWTSFERRLWRLSSVWIISLTHVVVTWFGKKFFSPKILLQSIKIMLMVYNSSLMCNFGNRLFKWTYYFM